MNSSKREFIFYGDDIRIESFPEETRFIYANPPLPPAASPEDEIRKAIDSPIGASPLESQLDSRSRVTIAFDDLCVPVPLMRQDIRGRIIQALLQRLFAIGIPKERIRLICANGLHRKWTIKELTLVLGKAVVDMVGPGQISCHDATVRERLVNLGTTQSGMTVEMNRAVAESDMTIYVNVNFTSMNGGWKSVMVGLGSWESIRCHHTPREWNGIHSIMDPEHSPMHATLFEMGQQVREKYNIFQIESVINNRLWPPVLSPLLSPFGPSPPSAAKVMALKSLFSIAALPPRSLKRGVRNMLRSAYQLRCVYAGDVDRVHQRTLEAVTAQQNVSVDGPADIVIFGVPNLSPYSARSIFNPILLRSLILGYMRGMYRGRPLVKENGVIIALNPGIEKFHPGHHPSYIDFWNRDLAQFGDPESCWETLADRYADDPGYLEKYRNGFAYHGTHSLINWFWSGMALRRVRAVILAGAKEPETAKKIGFIPAGNLSHAIDMAREMAGDDATIAYPVMPPLFGVDVGGVG